MFDFLMNVLREEYDICRELRNSDRCRILLLRHRTSGNLFILRHYHGAGDAYEKLKGIRCPHIPVIYETARKEDEVLVLEEYISGDSLRFLLDAGPLTQKQTKQIILQLCDALWAIHHLGLVHRDIKPENILLRGDEAFLIDFDATRVHKPESRTDTQVLGTIGYAAPEQFGFSQTDARADIYSLGVLMNIMLMGKHPSIAMPPGKWGLIIRRCTMTNPRQRFSDVRMIRALL